MLQEKERVEVIIPIYNEELCVDELLKRLLALKEKINYLKMNFIFVNDGSSDRCPELLRDYANQYNFVKVINFSRNFGHQFAVTAGLDYADADYVVIMDGDLQDPPELIEDLYKKSKQGYDVVYGKRLRRKGESFFKEHSARIFYKVLSMMCDIKIPPDTGDFRLINIDVLKVLKEMRERHRFIRGMVPWVGLKSAELPYQRDKRYAGKTKYPLKKMLAFALDAIFSFSNTPLRITIYFGLLIVGLGMAGALLILYLRFFTPFTIPGISAVIVTIITMAGFQIIMLGVIGEYIGRIFEESKSRPLYVVKDVMNLNPIVTTQAQSAPTRS